VVGAAYDPEFGSPNLQVMAVRSKKAS
jgi:hypothetical protein